MSDPFSIVAGSVSLVVPALHGTRLLLDDLYQLKDAPKTVQRLTDEVQSVDAALKLLQGVEESEWALLGTGIAEQSEVTINSCTKACELFRADLRRWTRHSGDGKLAWQDRSKVGFLKQSQIKAMSEQLSSCKLTINSVVSIAALYSSVRHRQITEEIKSTISAKQTEIQGAIATANRQLVGLEIKLEELNTSDDDDDDVAGADELRQDRAEVFRQLEEVSNAVRASQKLLNELLLRSQEESVAKAARKQSVPMAVTFGENNSGVQAGTINGGFNGAVFGGGK